MVNAVLHVGHKNTTWNRRHNRNITKRKKYNWFFSRFLEETPKAAAHQQEELLGEEHPGDLVEWGVGLAAQVQNGGS